MLQRFRILHFLLLLGALIVLPSSTGAQRSRPTRLQEQDTSAVLECRVFCSDEKLRTAVAELTWRSTEARLSSSRIEVTVYKDGFKTGNYVALASTKGARSYQLQQRTKDLEEIAPALRKLVVLDAGSSRSNLRGRSNVVAVRIEGLEAGVNYFWRVMSTTSERLIAQGTARCQAPVCPADFQPGEKP